MTFHRGSRAGYLSDVAAVRFFTPLLHGCVTWGLHLLYPISSTTVSHFKKLCCRTFQSWYCIWKRALANSARVLRSHSLGGQSRMNKQEKQSLKGEKKGWVSCWNWHFLRSVVHVDAVWCAFSLYLLTAQSDRRHAVVRGELWYIGLLLHFVPRA